MDLQAKEYFAGLGIARVWVLDFEYELDRAHVLPQNVVCMVAQEVLTGVRLVLAPGGLTDCPFASDGSELFVAYNVEAEAGCFLKLGWPLPPKWLDLMVEERRLVNGAGYPAGSLLASIKRRGLKVRDTGHKKHMQVMIGSGEWTAEDVPIILEYCAEDVEDTVALLGVDLPLIVSEAPTKDPTKAIGQAIIRGRFMAECIRMAAEGLPVDVPTWDQVRANFDSIKSALIAEVDTAHGYHVFEGDKFSSARFADYLRRTGTPWPRLPTGALALSESTFSDMAKSYPHLYPLRELRVALAQFRNNKVQVSPDGRSRAPLRPFTSKTARSQPSNSRYLFGLSMWSRSFLRAPEDYTLAYLDFASQELAIAAHLSGDAKLRAAYESGDPYMAFAIDAGLAPTGATKATHGDIRTVCKSLVLGVQYGMGEQTLALKAGVHTVEARELLHRHFEVYRDFWKFIEEVRHRAALSLPVYTNCGWRIQVGPGQDLNERSNGNWIIQSTGSDILRVATIRCTNAGVPAIATVHDALMFCVPIATADEQLAVARAEMEASALAVAGGPIRVDVKRYDYPEVYADERGTDFYKRITALANEPRRAAGNA